MAILNRASDGLPSVLVLLVRTLRVMKPMPRERLEALVAPPSLQQVSDTFADGKMVRQTLNRWLQIGLFQEEGGVVSLSDDAGEGPTEGLAGVRALGDRLRRLVLAPHNNADLLRPEPGQAADFTHALCWMLTQDPFRLSTGTYESLINRLEGEQVPDEPLPFRNDTRWDGFRDWAPLLGFGWETGQPRSRTFIVDPAVAVRAALPQVFGGRDTLSQAAFFEHLAQVLPVIDGGAYRTAVEGRLKEGTWRPTAAHEVSPTLTASLLRLRESGALALESRSDAPHRTLLGRGFAPVARVSHLRWTEAA